ncbi:UNVERIFIED_CONTAM: hypothetical protein FKN15_047998 [Acipenser sinensis]
MRTGTSDPAQEPIGLQNHPWYLYSTCTGPSGPALGPSVSQNGPWRLYSAHGPQRLTKRSLAPPQHGHGPQPPRAGSERLGKHSLEPLERAHGPQLPSVGVLAPRHKVTGASPACVWAPATPCGVPAALQTVPVASEHAQKPSDSPNGAWRL